ncbi:MAG: 4Fe-4S binding protein [Anaerolineae bacterium]|nr:4Fe-4S binding protein [Anaerolineae bacterium]
MVPEINSELCVRCGDCLSACPEGALSLGEEGIILDEEKCAYCGDCEDICPTGAIALPFAIVLAPLEDEEEEDVG